MREKIKRFSITPLLVVAIIALFLLSACGTMQGLMKGIGKDLEGVARKIQRSAEPRR
ncbi:MAG: ECN family pore-forming entericidin [Nitrospinota bacterium]|nr:ECN family pore-forming entericidin [Nitrospinota bacterium]